MEHNVDPFPVSECLLCYFVASLGRQGLAPSTIKTYLAGIRHAQIVRGYPAPRESSSLPRLGLLQAGMKRVRAEQSSTCTKQRLPITPHQLRQIRELWNARAADMDTMMLWAAVTSCFFGFFRSGKITALLAAASDPAVHLAWGDVAVDNVQNLSVVRVHLKQSKCNQFGN